MDDWDRLLREHGPAVWRTAYRLLGNHPDADDCFQDTFVAAVAVARRSAVTAWPALLRRLATARALDRLRCRYRSAGRLRPADLLSLPDSQPPPGERAEAEELAEQLRAALAELPARPAEVFCLHALDGWSVPEIARHLNLSADAVGVALHRARQRLRPHFAPTVAPTEERP